jgi:predicted DNA-binding transcriptional regulator YafY
MAAKRDSPIVRQWTLLSALARRRHGSTVADLAREHGVSEKTVRRDLLTLAGVGFSLSESVGPHGRKAWRVDGEAPALSFPLDEALALYLGRRLMDPLAGTFLGQAAQRAFAKVRAVLARSALDYLDRMAGNLYVTAVGTSDYSRHAERADDLLRAIEDRRATLVTSHSLRSTEPVEHEVFPYGLVWHKGSLYLVAHSRDHGEVRHFKLNRIHKVDVTEFPFQMPDGFDLARHLAGSFGVFQGAADVAVRVRFAPEAARYVKEGQWHASQRLRPLRDGSLLAEFRLSSTEELKRWLLSFGRRAEVLSPPALRQELADEAAAIARQHAGPPLAGALPEANPAGTDGVASAAQIEALFDLRDGRTKAAPPAATGPANSAGPSPILGEGRVRSTGAPAPRPQRKSKPNPR